MSRTNAMLLIRRLNRKGDEGMRNIVILLVLLAFLLFAIFFAADIGDAIMAMFKGFFGIFK